MTERIHTKFVEMLLEEYHLFAAPASTIEDPHHAAEKANIDYIGGVKNLDDVKDDIIKRNALSGDNNISHVVDTFMANSGWVNDTAKRTLIDLFLDKNTHTEKVRTEWLKIREEKSPFEAYIREGGVSNILSGELFNKKLSTLFKDEGSYRKWIHTLHNTTFQEKRAGVGKGELLITAATSSVKGNVGDIGYNGVEIEIKGTGARVGGKAYFYHNGAKNIWKMLSDEFEDEVEKLSNKSTIESILLAKYFIPSNIDKDFNAGKLRQERGRLFSDIRETLSGGDIDGARALIESSTILPDNIKNDIVDRFDKAVANTIKIDRNDINAVSNYTTTNVAMFVLNNKDDIIDAMGQDGMARLIYEMRSYPDYDEDTVNYIRTNIETITANKQSFQLFVGALHLLQYSLNHSFHKIMLINDGSGKCLVFNAPKDANMIDSVYKRFTDGGVNVTVSLGLDAAAQSASITIS